MNFSNGYVLDRHPHDDAEQPRSRTCSTARTASSARRSTSTGTAWATIAICSCWAMSWLPTRRSQAVLDAYTDLLAKRGDLNGSGTTTIADFATLFAQFRPGHMALRLERRRHGELARRRRRLSRSWSAACRAISTSTGSSMRRTTRSGAIASGRVAADWSPTATSTATWMANDFNVWQAAFGFVRQALTPGSGGSSATAVPEPAMLWLWVIGRGNVGDASAGEAVAHCSVLLIKGWQSLSCLEGNSDEIFWSLVLLAMAGGARGCRAERLVRPRRIQQLGYYQWFNDRAGRRLPHGESGRRSLHGDHWRPRRFLRQPAVQLQDRREDWSIEMPGIGPGNDGRVYTDPMVRSNSTCTIKPRGATAGCPTTFAVSVTTTTHQFDWEVVGSFNGWPGATFDPAFTLTDMGNGLQSARSPCPRALRSSSFADSCPEAPRRRMVFGTPRLGNNSAAAPKTTRSSWVRRAILGRLSWTCRTDGSAISPPRRLQASRATSTRTASSTRPTTRSGATISAARLPCRTTRTARRSATRPMPPGRPTSARER